MKIFCNIVKKLCLGLFSIYSINVLFSTLNINLPINIYTVTFSSLLGIFGTLTLLIMKLVI